MWLLYSHFLFVDYGTVMYSTEHTNTHTHAQEPWSLSLCGHVTTRGTLSTKQTQKHNIIREENGKKTWLNCPTCWICAIEHAHQTSHTHARLYDILTSPLRVMTLTDDALARVDNIRTYATHNGGTRTLPAHNRTKMGHSMGQFFFFILAHLLSSSLHRRLNRTKQHVLRGTRGYRVRTGKVARWLEIDATKGAQIHTHIELMIWCIWMGTSNLVLCT